MSDQEMRPRLMEIGACPICRRLDACESSFEKWGWPEQTRRLPPEAQRLAPVDAAAPENDRVERCPQCGTFYRYKASYEYLVNGSEDTEELTRLTPNEARAHLTAEEYARAMRQMRVYVAGADPRTREFAARSLGKAGGGGAAKDRPR